MNILEISNTFGLGGTEKTMQLYCKYLNRKKFNVYSCAFLDSGPREKFIKKFSNNTLIALGREDVVIKYIKMNGIDILHWHGGIRSNTNNRAKMIKILSYCKENSIETVETSPFSNFEPVVDGLFDFRIFVSRTSLLKFYWKNKIANTAKKKYFFNYNPLDVEDLERNRLTNSEIDKARKNIGIKKDDFVIGRVGRADIWKWSDEIINIVPHLVGKIPNIKVVIRAIPKEKIDKIKKNNLEKYFILLPETIDEKELYETYQVIDVLVHTSRIGETFGIAMAEAMFFGKPIVTNSTDFMQFTLFDRDNGQSEVVENGKNGFVINSVEEMARRIIFLKENDKVYRTISERNSKKASDVFDAKKVVKNFENIILNKKQVENVVNGISYYKEKRLQDSPLDLIKINSKTLVEYIRYIKLGKYGEIHNQ